MRIKDLYESEFKDGLNSEIMNVLMMIMKTNVPETDVENVMAELEKQDIVASEDDIKEFIDSNDNFSLGQDGKIVFITGDSDIADEDRPDLETEKEYNPAVDKAKEATKKRSK